jgi:hypothetical protein
MAGVAPAVRKPCIAILNQVRYGRGRVRALRTFTLLHTLEKSYRPDFVSNYTFLFIILGINLPQSPN